MGVVSLLVTDGIYQFSPPNRTYLGPRGHNRGPHTPHIGRGAAAKCERSLSSVVGTAMVTNGTYQTKLAKEYYHISAWEDKGTRGDAVVTNRQERSNLTIRREYQYTGRIAR